ncbi:TPA: hypothetical protein N0F65_000050 [Lagenidium giganteum]|uniref:Uncharacterized protein n=1 Tax=Lagenidium giganteum TaxID=4803 RepID=A0AAV2YPY1_9STRA|nr:TPA: hypothetical protein N0F65_000050 [Lagenidium giganteum]
MAFTNAAPFAAYLVRIRNARLFAQDQVMIVVDAYKRLVLFDAQGHRTLLFDSVNGKRIKFLNSLVVL